MKKLFLLFVLVTLAFGCARGSTPTEPQDIAPKSASTGICDFSYSLFESYAVPGQNTVISPVSVAMALSMASEGAAGDTLGEFERLLGQNADSYYSGLASKLLNEDNATVTTFNGIYVNSSVSPKQSYLSRLANAYHAQIYTAPFTDPGIIRKINGDVALSTNNLIPEIISSLSADDRAVLLNTLYFKAAWRTAFEEHATHPGDFFIGDKKVTTQFMNGIQRVPYVENSDWQALSLPYKNERYAMILVMPADGKDIKSVLPVLKDIPAQVMAASAGNISIAMPKFTVEGSYTLREQLIRMGLGLAFDPKHADFTGILDEKPLYLSQVIHKTKLIADEGGTEAAAATAITIRTTGMPIVNMEIRFERPFIYVLWDNETQVPLFLGTLETPKE